jgi:hypothetical protein
LDCSALAIGDFERALRRFIAAQLRSGIPPTRPGEIVRQQIGDSR